jgi:hypothetical protein
MEHQQGQSAHGSTCTVDTLPTAQENGSKLDDVKKVFEVATVDVSGSFVSDTAEAVDDQTATEAPYHVFTVRMKWQVVLIVSLAGLFSSLSSNIYFPAIPAIAAVSSKERRDVT